jgi:autotransporter-associated beta strand protein
MPTFVVAVSQEAEIAAKGVRTMSILERTAGRWGTDRSGTRRRRSRQRLRRQLGIETLEIRLVPAISTWLGTAGADWSTAANWDTPPATGSDLVFPSGASNLANTDDLGSMTFGTLTVSGSGYQIGGDSAAFSSIDASLASGTSTVSLPVGLSGPVSVDSSGSTLVLAGMISGSTGLTKKGSGTLDLTAANTYTGTTSITAGTLLIDGVQAGSPVAVGSGSTLGGIGTVASITTGGATVSPGDGAAGVLVDSGSLSLGQDASSSASTYSVVIDGSTPGTGADHYSQTQVAGSIALNGATLNITVGPDFTQSVPTSFTIIDNTGSSTVTGTFSGLPQGGTTVISGVTFAISYTGGSSSNSVVLTEVDPSTVSVSSPTVSPVYGQSVELDASVTGSGPTPTGTVEFFNGATELGTATLSSGSATFDASTLPVANNSITAQYLGDANYAGSTSVAAPVVVTTAASNTALAVFPVSPVTGQSVTLSATVTVVSPGVGTPTGTVEFMNGASELGTAVLADGVASYQTSAIPAGGNSITADYLTDGNFSSSNSAAVSVTVASTSTTTTTLSYSPSAPAYGQSVTLTADVSPAAATGTVNFYSGTTLLGSGTVSGGVASYPTTALALGANSITAVYSGDSTYTSSGSSAASITVVQSNSTTVVTYFPGSPVAGQTVTLTATVSPANSGTGTPTGSVEFFNGTDVLGTVNLASGVATLQATSLSTGANAITAQYEGDNNFNGSLSPAVSVTLAAAATSSTTVTYTPSSPVYGSDVTLSASVAAVSPLTGTPTGTVEFYEGTTALGSATLSGGAASLAPMALPAGANAITAIYSGDSTFTASTSPAVTVTVAKVTTTTSVTATPSTPSYGQSVTLTATVVPATTGSVAPTGTVTFFNGSTTLGTGSVAGGVATLVTTSLPAGTGSVTATYGGDTNYASSTSPAITVPVAVTATTIAVTYFPTSPVVSQNVTLTATVSSVSPGGGTPTGTVEFLNGSTSLGTGTLVNGVATLVTAALASGSNTINATYDGDSNFSGSAAPAIAINVAATATSSTTVTYTPASPTYGTSVTFTATIVVTSGTPTGTVNFYNGTTLLGSGTVSTASGVTTASLSTTALPAGSNSVTAQYSGDSSFTSSTSPAVAVTVTEVATTTAVTFTPSSPAVGATVTLTATVTSSSAGATSPSGTVDFFNGTTLLGTGTLSTTSGVTTAAFATSSLPAGSNSVTAQYLGDSNYAGSTSPATTVTVTEFIAVTYSPALPVYGSSVTLTATLSPTGSATPSGTVNFYNGSTLLGTASVASDVATLSTTTLAVGNNAVTAVYSGDSNYPASTSAIESVAVVLAGTTTTVSLSDTNPALGETVTLTAAVAVTSPGAGTPTGTVQFFNDGTLLGTSAVSGGQATLSVVLPIGASSITAQYSGDSNFESSAATAVAAAGGTADEQWLNQVYLIELGRSPTTSDYTYWDTQIADGRSLKAVVSEIVSSPEAAIYRIQTAFTEYLGKEGTEAQVRAVLAEAAATHTSVRAAILGSREFYAQSGGTAKGFLSAAETAVLGITVDQPVLKAQLASGASRTAIANELLESNLGKQVLLVSSYQTVLQSAPTNQQIVAYVGLMNDGIYLRTIVASLLASSEFYNNATASLTALSS